MAKKKPDPQELAEIDEFYTRLTGLPADPPRRKGGGRFLLLLLILVLFVAVLLFAFPERAGDLTDWINHLFASQGGFYGKTQSI